MTDWGYVFGLCTHVTCSEHWTSPIPIQLVFICWIIQHHKLDQSDMLISTEMPGIQCYILHLVIANQRQSPCQSHTCKTHSLQMRLLYHVRAYYSETCLSEPGMSETMSETMSKLLLPEQDISGPQLLVLHLSETMSVHTFIPRIIRDHVRATLVIATLIKSELSATILELYLSQQSGHKFNVVIAIPISGERYWSS